MGEKEVRKKGGEKMMSNGQRDFFLPFCGSFIGE